MYSVSDYGAMIADPVRMNAYALALARSVRPGDVVVDVGCGTGILSLIACKLGARRVYAIEPSPCIEFARRCAAKNGFADRITFFESRSTEVELPEMADVLVSDLRGSTPLSGSHLSATADARARLLKRGGIQIPLRDRLIIAPVEIPALYASITSGSSFGELDLSPCLEVVVNAQHVDAVAPLQPHNLLAAPEQWATLDYVNMGEPRVSGRASFEVSRSGVFHGFGGWFAAELADGIGYANSPFLAPMIYARTLLLSPDPVAVSAGDRVTVAIFASEHAREGVAVGWSTTIESGSRTRAQFKQSTLSATPIGRALGRLREP